jgi:seryl-tRNA synthetase
MLDLAFIRNHPDIVKEAARVKYNSTDIDYLLEVDRQVLELQRRVEEARAEQNKISERIREAGKDRAQRGALIAEGKLLAGQIKAMEPLLHELEESRQQLLYLVPNIPDPSSPIGKDENDNVPIRYWGEKPAFDFQPLDHYALMQKLDVVDIERAVKVAGARSYALKGDAARLELALVNDLCSESGGLLLPLDSTATRHTFAGVPLWLHGPRHQGPLTNTPS